MKYTVLAGFVMLCMVTDAFAFCSEPSGFNLSPPRPPASYEKPQKPECLNGYGVNALDCDARDFEEYKIKLERYQRALEEFAEQSEAFARSAQDYQRDAEQYVSCEQRSLRE
ncbi:MAG: hypothetical protein KDJ35_02555 [Alphaproteobacteria bacterium]|nr:hypothetical protein [Alphaproteobacteria bacterium]